MEMKARRAVWRVAGVLCALFVIAACVPALFFPYPRPYGRAGQVLCAWENGAAQWESYAAAAACVCAAEPQRILLEREGVRGYVEAGEGYRSLYARFEGAPLADLLGAAEALAPIERAALWRSYCGTIWYDGDCFAWDGEEVRRMQQTWAERVVLISGELERGVLARLGASELSLRAESEPCAADLEGSAVQQIVCEAPFYMQGMALCKSTAGGARLIGALPQATELQLSGLRYADRGALLACTRLSSLTMPFVGNALSDAGSAYDGHLGYLFSESGAQPYHFPQTLTCLSVTGGRLHADALYGMDALETLVLCGIPAQDVSVQAFGMLPALGHLHTTADWTAEGFERRVLACGCYEYFRR